MEARWIGEHVTVYRPVKMSTLLDLLAALPAPPRFVSGNTMLGIYKTQRFAQPDVVDISLVAELKVVAEAAEAVTFGSGLVLSDLKDRVAPLLGQAGEALAEHLEHVASTHIRNRGSVGGNVMMAKQRGFVSDVATLLMGLNATVTLAPSHATLPLHEFVVDPEIGKQVVVSFTIPRPAAESVFHSYRTATRRKNAHAWINAAFSTRIVDGRFTHTTLAYGGVMQDYDPASHPVLATAVMEKMDGMEAVMASFHQLLPVLTETIQPVSEAKREFRASLVPSFLFKFFNQVCPDGDASAGGVFAQTVQTNAQTYAYPDTHAPVSQPVPRPQTFRAATGEVQYVGDMPDLAGTVHAVFVQARAARATLKSIDASRALAHPSAVAFFGAADIPGTNCVSMSPQEASPLFVGVGEEVRYYGQPVGVFVAATREQAETLVAEIEVELDNAQTPILTVPQCEEAGGEFALQAPKVVASSVAEGESLADLLAQAPGRKVSGTFHIGTQLHWYMEPQSAFCVPNPDGVLQIYSAYQFPIMVHTPLCKLLDLPMNQVHLKHTQLGGGFGGKLSHPTLTAGAVGVAAMRLNRPVKMVLDRNADSELCGGREDSRVNYIVGFTDDGMITSFQTETTIDMGFTQGLSGFAGAVTANQMMTVYHSPVYENKAVNHVSNKHNRTSTRGPGEVQPMLGTETVIDHIAHETGIPAEEIRKKNFVSGGEGEKWPNGQPVTQPFNVPDMFDELLDKSNFAQVKAEVEAFNATHRYTKRGCSAIPMRYEVGMVPKTCLINVYTDGSVVVHNGGVEMGQGLNVKVLQTVSYGLREVTGEPLPLERIQLAEHNTAVLPNQTFTGGSTGSEGACMAALHACTQLVQILKPTREQMEAGGMEGVTWDDVCARAGSPFGGQDSNLCVVGHHSAREGDLQQTYNCYGVGMNVVELDVLTGQVQVLKSHLLYDSGKALNPAVDIGQAEGAYVMGIGHMLQEECSHGSEGSLVSNGTWEYKPPLYNDIPQDWTVELKPNAAFPAGVLSSKCSGEPPFNLSMGVISSIRMAIQATGVEEFVQIDIPATPERLRALVAPAVTFE